MAPRRYLALVALLAAAGPVAACQGGGGADAGAAPASVAIDSGGSAPAEPATTRAVTDPTSALPARSQPATTVTAPATVPDQLQQVEIGRTVEGRPIVAVERGTPGGTVVLVIGVIHGDETAGTAIVRRLASSPLPPGIDLWLVESVNPDGQARGTRTNAHQVDLNRNFPSRWAPLDQPGEPEYAGTGPASEPETQAIVGLISLIQPQLALWYHQDLFRIAPSTGHAGRVRQRYAELTGLPMARVTGGTYTGTAASWEQRTFPQGVAFIVELGPTLSPQEADVHALAVLALAGEE